MFIMVRRPDRCMGGEVGTGSQLRERTYFEEDKIPWEYFGRLVCLWYRLTPVAAKIMCPVCALALRIPLLHQRKAPILTLYGRIHCQGSAMQVNIERSYRVIRFKMAKLATSGFLSMCIQPVP